MADAAVTVFVQGPAGPQAQWEAVPAIEVDDGRVSVSVSGMLMAATTLLTSMEAFYPFLKDSCQPCSFLCDPELAPTTVILVRQGGDDAWTGATLCFGIRLEPCDDAFAPLKAKGWTCGYMNSCVLGSFGVAILRLESPLNAAKPALGRRLYSHTTEPTLFQDACVHVGDDIQLFASPFAVVEPTVFTRATTKGCIASVDSNETLYLLDLRTYCGAEGGIIVRSRGSAILGICAPPLLQSGTPSTFAVGIPLKIIFAQCASLPPALRLSACSMLGVVEDVHSRLSSSTTCGTQTIPNVNVSDTSLSTSVVMLSMHGSWASGVAITPRVILTCAHFITGSSGWMATPNADGMKYVGTKCRVEICDETFDATIMLVFDGFLDVALLEVERPVLTPIRWCVPKAYMQQVDALQTTLDTQISFCDDAFAESSPVKVLGFPLFGRRTFWKTPIETHGVITKMLTNARQLPIMIQTSAAVFSGSSGGALLTPKNELIGLVTTNVRMVHGGVLPFINFSLPSGELLPTLDVGAVSYSALRERWKTRDLGEKERNLWLLKAEPLQLPSFILERKKRGEKILRKMPPNARL